LYHFHNSLSNGKKPSATHGVLPLFSLNIHSSNYENEKVTLEAGPGLSLNEM